ncbi:response regulator [Geitlerinema sp. P-1104]|uniref:hybrid sensor histidine kinase/response regulator n=1 Tax=Geitlerinema sp. P-1104 TaxID=2546230 RepID=UPI001476B664|nr:response regulator [Geitlerinema sp. P-1104]NMG57917.1 response regulator [Geitlerinema sp. P-1104]
MTAAILVIDDEPDNFDVIDALLSQEDYELSYAASGPVALSSLESYDPDLILLDVMMPDVDGIEICRRLKGMPSWRTVPIIMVTALSSKDNLARCLEAGADDFIGKPVNGLELRARVKSMLRLKYQYDELQGLLQLREDLVKMILHDVRNPLSGLLLGLELLRSPNYPEAKRLHRLETVYSLAQSVQTLVEELLQVTLTEAGQLTLNYSSVDVGELVQCCLSRFEAIAAQKNLSLVSQCPDTPVTGVELDPTLFQRVLDNLMSNAIKFSPQGTQITMTVRELNPEQIQIEVIDGGPGVPDELREKIFEKYEIGTMMANISQIGLGLAFCKMVIQGHEGTIQVHPHPEQGSIFQILVPRRPLQASQVAPETALTPP